MFRQLIVTSVFIACVACSDTTASTGESSALQANVQSTTQESTQQETRMKDMTKISGQLVYQDMEGGFFGFIADNGDKYTLRGLDKSYRQNGMRMVVTAVPIDIMTITQFGKVMQVQEVLSADNSEVKPIERKPGSKLM